LISKKIKIKIIIMEIKKGDKSTHRRIIIFFRVKEKNMARDEKKNKERK